MEINNGKYDMTCRSN